MTEQPTLKKFRITLSEKNASSKDGVVTTLTVSAVDKDAAITAAAREASGFDSQAESLDAMSFWTVTACQQLAAGGDKKNLLLRN